MMCILQAIFLSILAAVLAAFSPSAFAQDAAAKAPPVDRISQMQGIAQSLGVKCNYCHSAARGSGEPEPKKMIAKAMMDMTDEINSRVRAATGNPAGQATEVQCSFCHRG